MWSVQYSDTITAESSSGKGAMADLDFINFNAEQLNREELEKLALLYTNYVRALIGAILEYTGSPATTIRKSLNGVTTYSLPISESVLPNKSNWNIYEPSRK